MTELSAITLRRDTLLNLLPKVDAQIAEKWLELGLHGEMYRQPFRKSARARNGGLVLRVFEHVII